MKKNLNLIQILILFFIFLFCFPVFSEDKKYESPMTIYKDNYFISGDKEEDQVKFQVSAKYSLFYPSKIGIYAGYTQICWWKIYNDSAPFYETNYQPELFLKLESNNNIFGDADFSFVDYIQISPIHHCSNGRDGLDSRSINDYYSQIQLSVGEHYNFGTNIKVFNYYNKSSKNKDIEIYKSYYEADVFFKIKSKNVSFLDKEELHFKFGGYDKSDFDQKDYTGWYCVEAQFRIITSVFQPKLFIQYYNGYGEFLIDYNKKEDSVRVGLVF